LTSINLSSPIESFPRVSAAYQKRLNRLGIKTIEDLLHHFPFRYDDLSKISKIADLKINEIATIRGEIINIKILRTFKKKMWLVEALIKDDSGTTRAVWYNQPFLIRAYRKGTWISLAGKVNYDKKTFFFSNPAHEKISPPLSSPPYQGGEVGGVHTGRLIPIYSETAGLSSKWLRYILKIIWPKISTEIIDFLPEEIKKSQNLIGLKEALEKIHFPQTPEDINLARQRLGFNELFLIQLFVLEQKQKWQKQNSPKIKFNQELIKNFVSSLPFRITNAQRKSAWEILQDMEKSKPMNRLLEGDVGSGKTVVAAIAALQAIKAGFQVAFMAPTEILAQQHFNEISKLLKNFNVKVGLLTSADARTCSGENWMPNFNLGQIQPKTEPATSLPVIAKQSRNSGIQTTIQDESWHPNNKANSKKPALIKKISDGKIQIIIGTHSLIQKNIIFKNLGLVIVDEQHRFGVNQRQALLRGTNAENPQERALSPHFLSMTATPIPRTLALTIYGDLDLSLLNEMPKGRQKIITKIVAPQNREKAYNFIRQQIEAGRQAFVICPRIETTDSQNPSLRKAKSDLATKQSHNNHVGLPHILPTGEMFAMTNNRWSDTKTVTEEYEKLSKKIFFDFKIAMLHGRLKPKEKEKIMADFKNKKTQILVSTSVIEVGIDIPNASVIMVEGAERFGLAQLYQFRGRVGRDKHQSYCFLFTESSSQTISHRLKAIAAAQSGFELAEKDLEIRGPGEFWGGQQWGLPDLIMASLSDAQLIKSCREEAEKLLSQNYNLENFPLLKEKLKKFQQNLHLE